MKRHQITIKQMQTTQLNEVMAIDAACYRVPWPKTVYEAELACISNRCYLVAYLQSQQPQSNNTLGTIVGHGGVSFEADAAHITTLTVAPQWRGHGVGIRLFLALAVAARKHKESLMLEVGADNPTAQSLYRRFGLAPVGIRRGYYAKMGLSDIGLSPDAVVMRADNIQEPDYASRLAKIALELEHT